MKKVPFGSIEKLSWKNAIKKFPAESSPMEKMTKIDITKVSNIALILLKM